MKNFQLTFSSYPLSHQVSFSVQATSEEAVEEFSQGMLYGIESSCVGIRNHEQSSHEIYR